MVVIIVDKTFGKDASTAMRLTLVPAHTPKRELS